MSWKRKKKYTKQRRTREKEKKKKIEKTIELTGFRISNFEQVSRPGFQSSIDTTKPGVQQKTNRHELKIGTGGREIIVHVDSEENIVGARRVTVRVN